MSGQAKVYIAGIGMITPVGADTAMTAAAVRARVSGYQASRHYNQQSQRITMAGVPDEVFSSMQAEIDEDNGYSEQQDHTTPGAFRLPAARNDWAMNEPDKNKCRLRLRTGIPVLNCREGEMWCNG